jgi:hypothetical protein
MGGNRGNHQSSKKEVRKKKKEIQNMIRGMKDEREKKAPNHMIVEYNYVCGMNSVADQRRRTFFEKVLKNVIR